MNQNQCMLIQEGETYDTWQRAARHFASLIRPPHLPFIIWIDADADADNIATTTTTTTSSSGDDALYQDRHRAPRL